MIFHYSKPTEVDNGIRQDYHYFTHVTFEEEILTIGDIDLILSAILINIRNGCHPIEEGERFLELLYKLPVDYAVGEYIDTNLGKLFKPIV